MSDDWKRTSKKEKAKQKMHAENELKQKLKEDKAWEETDKYALEKEKRRQEKLQKQQEESERKKINKEEQEKEMKEMAAIGKNKQPQKLTQFEINKRKQQMALLANQLPNTTKKEEEIQENPNLVNTDACIASDIDEALSLLNMDSKEKDMHSEKRVKAAFNKQVDENMSRIKEEFKNLKRTQQIEKLWKEFKKSPDNPFNNE